MFYWESKSARGALGPGGPKSAVTPVVIGAFGSVRKKNDTCEIPETSRYKKSKSVSPRNYSYTKSLSIK